MPLKINIEKPTGVEFFLELKPNQVFTFVSQESNSIRHFIVECERGDQQSTVSEAFPEETVRIKTRTRVLAILTDKEEYHLPVTNNKGIEATMIFKHEKNTYSPKEVILMMFKFLGRKSLSFEDILILAVRQVWRKPSPPPQDLIGRMNGHVRTILQQMVKEGYLLETIKTDGQKHYSMSEGN